MLIVIFGAVGGTFLGLRQFRVVALVPVIFVVAGAAIVRGAVIGLDAHTMIYSLAAAVAVPQFAYFVAALPAGYVHLRHIRWSSRLLHTMQIAIGQELRSVYDLPHQLPREMVALLEQMNEKYGPNGFEDEVRYAES
jgi:hypothetical protein